MAENEYVEGELLALEEKLSAVAELPARSLSIPRGSSITRQQVVSTFQDAFEMIGGVPRFVLWADANEGDFYKLYGKLLPSTSAVILDAEVRHVVEHRLPPPQVRSGAIVRGKSLNEDPDDS